MLHDSIPYSNQITQDWNNLGLYDSLTMVDYPIFSHIDQWHSLRFLKTRGPLRSQTFTPHLHLRRPLPPFYTVFWLVWTDPLTPHDLRNRMGRLDLHMQFTLTAGVQIESCVCLSTTQLHHFFFFFRWDYEKRTPRASRVYGTINDPNIPTCISSHKHLCI